VADNSLYLASAVGWVAGEKPFDAGGVGPALALSGSRLSRTRAAPASGLEP
jgi:hypothetical protein